MSIATLITLTAESKRVIVADGAIGRAIRGSSDGEGRTRTRRRAAVSHTRMMHTGQNRRSRTHNELLLLECMLTRCVDVDTADQTAKVVTIRASGTR